MTRKIYEIAEEIKKDWKDPFFGAMPYIAAMTTLSNVDDCYGLEDAKTIIRYFLANASTWRGDVARRIKKELKSMLK